MSDAGWRGPTKITPHLHDAKATCIGVAPCDMATFADDFLVCVQNARDLQQQIATPDIQLRLGFAGSSQGQSNELKFRHVLFQVNLCWISPHVCS
jgi:hypothetical protein